VATHAAVTDAELANYLVTLQVVAVLVVLCRQAGVVFDAERLPRPR
jgi:hypothetical protein